MKKVAIKIEKDITRHIKLLYPGGATGKGCIIMMVVPPKSELAKTTNGRLALTYESKNSTKRPPIETEYEGRRKPKVKYWFKVKSDLSN